MTSLPNELPSPDGVIALVYDVTRAAFFILDGCEETEADGQRKFEVFESEYEELSKALDALDSLPEGLKENVIMEGPGKANFLLEQMSQRIKRLEAALLRIEQLAAQSISTEEVVQIAREALRERQI